MAQGTLTITYQSSGKLLRDIEAACSAWGYDNPTPQQPTKEQFVVAYLKNILQEASRETRRKDAMDAVVIDE